MSSFSFLSPLILLGSVYLINLQRYSDHLWKRFKIDIFYILLYKWTLNSKIKRYCKQILIKIKRFVLWKAGRNSLPPFYDNENGHLFYFTKEDPEDNLYESAFWPISGQFRIITDFAALKDWTLYKKSRKSLARIWHLRLALCQCKIPFDCAYLFKIMHRAGGRCENNASLVGIGLTDLPKPGTEGMPPCPQGSASPV